jgi:hypothetical protein
MLARDQSIQATSAYKKSCGSQDARQMIQAFDSYHSTGI